MRRAVETMHAHHLQVLAVVDETGKFVGVITQADILGFDELMGND
jgi:CBS domain-containing protein